MSFRNSGSRKGQTVAYEEVDDDEIGRGDDIIAKIPKQQDRIKDIELGVLMIDG